MKKIKLSCDACKKEFDDHECYNRHMKNHIALSKNLLFYSSISLSIKMDFLSKGFVV